MSQSQPNRPNTPGKKRTAVKAAAFFAVALLAALAVHGVYYFNGDSGEPLHGGSAEASAALDPADVLSELDKDLTKAVRAADVDANRLVGEANAEVDGAVMEAESHLRHASDKAQTVVTGATQSTGALPALPVDYVAGMPVVAGPVKLPDLSVAGFGDVGLGELAALEAVWSASASGIVDEGSALPEELAPIVSAYEDQTALLFNDPVTQPVWVIAGTAPVPLQSTLQGTLGDLPGAGDAIDPDEEGAQIAKEHADALLGTGKGLIDRLQAHVDTVEAQQSGIVDTVLASINETDSLAADQKAEVIEQADAAIEDALSDVSEKKAMLTDTVAHYEATVKNARTTAGGFVDDALATHVAPIPGVAKEQVAALRAQADAIEGDVQGHVDDVRTRGDEAVAALEATRQATGADVDEHIAMVESLVAQKTTAIEAEAANDVARLRSEADKLEARVLSETARLETIAFDAKSRLDALVVDAERLASDARAYGSALIDAEAERLIEETTMLATTMLADIDADAEAHKQAILAKAIELNGKAMQSVTLVESTAEAIYGTSTTHVEDDLEYILAVAEDYAKRGPADLEEKAQHWFDIHGFLDTTQDTVELSGLDVLADAGALLPLLDVVRGQLMTIA